MQKEWLQLLYLKGLPLRAKRILVHALGSPAEVLAAKANTLRDILTEAATHKTRSAKIPNMKYPEVADDMAMLARIGGDFIGFTEPDFPPLLNQIQSAPLGLFILGDRALLSSPQLAIVGSRIPTPSGRRTTQQFAAQLSAAGWTITSGMAVGIDSCAHQSCLAADGKTIAVMATGLDIVYPRSNTALSREIAENGAIVSEYALGTPPRREHFPQRNRLISGLSLGTLVVEAGIRSGSLVTARLAAEQGREVFAVPGSIHVAVSRGCHYLLRQGAKLVENSTDIFEELGQFFAVPAQNQVHSAMLPANEESTKLYNLLDYTPTSTDQLIMQSGLSADKVSYLLIELELGGLIAATTGGYQRLPQ